MSTKICNFIHNFNVETGLRSSYYDSALQNIAESFNWTTCGGIEFPPHALLLELACLHKSLCLDTVDLTKDHLDQTLKTINSKYLLHFLHGNHTDYLFVKSLETILNADYKTITNHKLFKITLVSTSPNPNIFYNNTLNVHLQKIRNLSLAYLLLIILLAGKQTSRSMRGYTYLISCLRLCALFPKVKRFCIEHIKNNMSFNVLLKSNKNEIKSIFSPFIHRRFFISHLKYHYNCTLKIIKNLVNNAYATNDPNYELYFHDVIIGTEINYDKLIDKTFDLDIYNMIALPTIKYTNIDAIKLNIEQYDPNMQLVIDI